MNNPGDFPSWSPFPNDEDLAMHSGVEVKKEKQDSRVEPAVENPVAADIFKPTVELVEVKQEESDPDYSPEEKGDLGGQNNGNKRKPKKPRKTPKKEFAFELPQMPPHMMEYYDVDVTEDFVAAILKYIDDLCLIISNGDPNVERVMNVNQGLNNAVNCYREKLNSFEEANENQDDLDDNMDHSEVKSENENQEPRKPGRPRGVKKPKEKKKKVAWKELLDIKDNDIKPTAALNAKTLDADDIMLFEYLRFNDKKMFECAICFKQDKFRHNAFRHIKAKHSNEIKLKSTEMGAPVQKSDCDGKDCKKLYGLTLKNLWCEQCITIMKSPKKYYYYKKVADRDTPSVEELCPECGKAVLHLKIHLRTVHGNKTFKCEQCNLEVHSTKNLRQHIRTVHEKVPCPECGKLFGIAKMKRHIQSQHTPDEEKKYKCDICGKGFVDNTNLRDHRNVHTGEKPYKCKYCGTCFASHSTHAVHQRSHLGIHRNKSKKKQQQQAQQQQHQQQQQEVVAPSFGSHFGAHRDN